MMKIVYEDENLWVIHKPAGLASQSAKPGEPDVVSKLKVLCKGGYVGIIHRLDQPVEGLLVFAKNKTTAAKLSAELSEGTLNKSYIAVVHGHANDRERVCGYIKKEGPVASYRQDISGISAEEQGQWKKAILTYERLAYDEENNISKIGIILETGRFHQIRCQMSGIGFPLLGDLKYGTKESIELSKKMRVRFVALCADRLSVQIGKKGELREFSILPEGMIFNEFAK